MYFFKYLNTFKNYYLYIYRKYFSKSILSNTARSLYLLGDVFAYTWSSAIGNCGCTSVVIHILNVVWISSESANASMASVQNGKDRCMFCRSTQPPFAMQSDIMFLACISWPWPIDTDRISENTKSNAPDNRWIRILPVTVLEYY